MAQLPLTANRKQHARYPSLPLFLPPSNWGSQSVHSCTCGPHKSLWECVHVCKCVQADIVFWHWERSPCIQHDTRHLPPCSHISTIFFIKFRGKGDKQLSDILQECHSKFLINQIVTLYSRKRYWLSVLQLLRVAKAEPFLAVSAEIQSQRPSTVWCNSQMRTDITHWCAGDPLAVQHHFHERRCCFVCTMYQCQVPQSVPGVWLFIT